MGWFLLIGISMNARIQGVPEYYSAEKWSVLFISNVSSVKLVANWCMSVKYIQLKGLCCFFLFLRRFFLKNYKI